MLIKKKVITIVEYWFIAIESNIQCPDWSAYVNKKTFNELKSFVDNNEADWVFSYIKKWPFWYVLVAQNFVWVIETKCWTLIEILPKITNTTNNSDIEKTRQIFLRMIKTLKDSPFKNLDEASLRNQKFPILEIFIELFLWELSALVKKWIKKNYITKVDNLKFVKWKLKIRENIVTNIVDKSKFVCEYDDFSENITENKLIKTCLLKLQKLSLSEKNKKLITLFLNVFSGIWISKNIKNDLKVIDHINRLNNYYLPTLKWVKLFLSDESVVNFSWQTTSLSLLFPMEKIFESYVANRLKKRMGTHRIDTQDSSFFLLRDVNNKWSFRLRPDIVIDKNNPENVIIADTKRKKLDSNSRIKKYSWINEDDVYQMLAYKVTYKSKRLYLIYPKNENFIKSIEYTLPTDWTILKAISYDLENDECEIFNI